MTDKNTLKNWFKRGAKPLASQFAEWIESFWHKDEQIPANKIDGLQGAFDQKADKEPFENLATDFAAHGTDENTHDDIRQLVFSEIADRKEGEEDIQIIIEQIRAEIENIIIGDIDEISSDEVDAITN